MAKSLGQIHTVNYLYTISQANQKFYADIPAQLSEQVQRMVRQGNYFKLVGIDAILAPSAGLTGGGSIQGEIRYYSPTRGRCAAYRKAFNAMRNAMKTQGISMKDNQAYDFRTPLSEASTYDNPTTYKNQATFDGTFGIHMGPGGLGGARTSVFDTHNDQLNPTGDTTPTFSEGYGVFGNTTDFVLNESNLSLNLNPDWAETEMETIPFSLSLNTTGDEVITNFQWRPDPALFLAVLTGQFDIFVDEADLESAAVGLEIAFHIAGWKSIMGEPRKGRMLSSKKNTRSGKK